ncbi:MAG: hypothetical protein ACE366_14100 [Bradymonadia bacterium]
MQIEHPNTTIDRERFLAAYMVHMGEPFEGEPPTSLEVLCEQLGDPDEWYPPERAAARAARDAMTPSITKLSADPLIDSLTIYPGDLVVDADFTLNNHVFVFGDLNVRGTITVSPAHAILMVVGDISCRAMELVRAYLFVHGTIRAETCVLGVAYGFNKVSGQISTRLYLRDDTHHNLTIEQDCDEEGDRRNIEAEHVVCVDDEEDVERLKGVLAAKYMARFDPFELMAAIAEGEDIFAEKES